MLIINKDGISRNIDESELSFYTNKGYKVVEESTTKETKKSKKETSENKGSE